MRFALRRFARGNDADNIAVPWLAFEFDHNKDTLDLDSGLFEVFEWGSIQTDAIELSSLPG